MAKIPIGRNIDLTYFTNPTYKALVDRQEHIAELNNNIKFWQWLRNVAYPTSKTDTRLIIKELMKTLEEKNKQLRERVHDGSKKTERYSRRPCKGNLATKATPRPTKLIEWYQ